MKARGFTLLELLIVIVIMGILAATLVVFLRPAFDSYIETGRRANLSDMADTAMRRMAQDIRSAVPNSIRVVDQNCFQFVPTITGGRYRMDLDRNLPNATYYQFVDTTVATTQFDVFNKFRTMPSLNDWIVVNNQNTNDVYGGTNRSQITSIANPPSPGGLAAGFYRFTINSLQFPYGYDGGRFQVVANNAQSVFYSCSGGSLLRTVATFADTNQCASTNASRIVATNVSGCSFVYAANAGATQQSGYIQMTMRFSDRQENVVLVHGVHVENAP